MAPDTTRVLAVWMGQEDEQAIRDMLETTATPTTRGVPFDVATAQGVDQALQTLQARPTDVAVLCLAASEPDALAPLDRLRERNPALPIVVVLDRDDERLAVQAAERGAQECIVRNELVGNLLARSLRYAMERQDLLQQLERRSVVDELTGLYNRRGFFAVGEQEWRRARRRGDGFLLVYGDLDGLKKVNDRLGHEEGDALIRSAARVLTAVFRGSDILARLGGDEFAVIAQQTADGAPEIIRDRLKKECQALREAGKLKHEVSFSLGIVAYRPDTDPGVTLDQLLTQADALMYEDKQGKQDTR